jgi:hypothetical protein
VDLLGVCVLLGMLVLLEPLVGLWASAIGGKEDGADLPVDPGLVPPRADRSAWAPKDIRRVNGVVGIERALTSLSSSMADSSKESEPVVEMLERRS